MKISTVIIVSALVAVFGSLQAEGASDDDVYPRRTLLNKRRRLGSNWYLEPQGRQNPPETLKWSTTKKAQKVRMQRVHGPKDSIGTMVTSTLLGNLFDEADEHDVGGSNWYLGHKGAKMPETLKWSTLPRKHRKFVCKGSMARKTLSGRW